MTRVTVAIPAFNEEQHIADVVNKAKLYVNDVIVCDDGSSDKTADLAREAGAMVIRHPRNMGKGAALKTLFAECRKIASDYVITLDGDGQHDPHEIPLLLERISKGDVDIVIGSRFLSKVGIPYSRVAGNKFLTFLTNMHAENRFTDTQSGFRIYSTKSLDKLVIREDGFAVDSQILFEATKNSFRIDEVPITVNYEDNTPTSHPVVHLTSVSGKILRVMIERNPLSSFGLLGAALLVVGLIFGIRVLLLFNETNNIAIGTSIISVAFGITGIIFIVGGAILHLINTKMGARNNSKDI